MLKYAKTVVEQLQDVVKNHIGPYSLSEYYRQKGMVLMLAQTLKRTRAWKKQQSKLLAKIADGTIASVNERENDDEEDAAVEADGVTDE